MTAVNRERPSTGPLSDNDARHAAGFFETSAQYHRSACRTFCRRSWRTSGRRSIAPSASARPQPSRHAWRRRPRSGALPRHLRPATRSRSIAEVKRASPSAGVIRIRVRSGRDRGGLRAARGGLRQRVDGSEILSRLARRSDGRAAGDRPSGAAKGFPDRPLPGARSAGRRGRLRFVDRRVPGRLPRCASFTSTRASWGWTP